MNWSPKVLRLILLVAGFSEIIPAHAEQSQKPPARAVDPGMISVTLAAKEDPVMLKMPIFLFLTVKNVSDEDLEIETGGIEMCAYFTSATVSVMDENGHPVPRGIRTFTPGGLTGSTSLPAKKEQVFVVWLSQIANIQTAGVYKVSVKPVLRIGIESGKAVSDVPVEATLSLPVLPVDEKKMGDLIDRLGNEMLAKRGQVNWPLYEMVDIDDERVIPWFTRGMREYNDSQIDLVAMEAFEKFNSDEALAGLVEGLPSSDAEIASEAARSLGQSPDPRASDILLKHRSDPRFYVRQAFLNTLYKKDASYAIPLLRKMLKDPNANIRSDAACDRIPHQIANTQAAVSPARISNGNRS